MSNTGPDRMMRETTVRLPPTIADYQPRLGSLIAAESEGALAAIAQLDAEHGPEPDADAGGLGRTVRREHRKETSRQQRRGQHSHGAPTHPVLHRRRDVRAHWQGVLVRLQRY